MKSLKTLIAIGMLSAIAGGALAEISVTFATTSGKLLNHSGTALSVNSLFLVFWSEDNSTAGFNNADPFAPIGGDILLDNPATSGSGYTTTPVGTSAGRIYNPASAYVWGAGAPQYGNGFMYVAIFETTYSADPTSVPVGTYYGLGPALDLTERSGVTPAPTPDNYGSLINAMNGGTGIQTSLQTVPEPTTLVLFGLGFAVVAARRMLSRG